MKKFLALVLAMLMVFSLCACGDGGDSGGDKVVKIGVFEPLTGDSAAGGKQEVLGMQYANSKVPTVEIGGETYKVELVYADNETKADKAVSAASNLVAQGVSIVLGTYGSRQAIAASETFKEAGIPAMGVTCTNPQITEGNSHYFRICFTDPFQGPVLASLAKDEFNADKVYCLSENGDDYGAGLVNYFKEKANELGIEVIEDVFPSQNADFTSYMNNAKKEGVKAIFAPVSISYAQLIIDQATAQGVNVPILGSDTWDTNTIFEVAKGKDIDIYVSTFYQEGANPEFEKGIKEWINSDSKNLENNGGNDMLSAVTVMGYDAYMVALEAIKAAGSTDPAAVMAALPGVTYEGISGHIEFNETGDANRDSAYIKSVNTETGAWDFVKVQKAS